MSSLISFFRHLIRPVDRLLNILSTPASGKTESRFDRFSRLATLTSLGIAILIALVTPFLALMWLELPFPGFLVEQTLVINSLSGDNWSGKMAGLDYPLQVKRLENLPVHSGSEFRRVIGGFEFGQAITVYATGQDGIQVKYTDILLTEFPPQDLTRLFWLPYGVSLVFLGMALWVYRLRGSTRSGRAFVFTCAIGAICLGSIFDLSSSQVFTLLWTISIAQIGGALVSLALLFPQEYQPVNRRGRLRVAAYGVSILLAVWGVVVLYSVKNPWAYILPWRYSYIYAGFGFLFFLGTSFSRLRFYENPTVNHQARLVIWGSLAAFAPLSIWFMLQIITPVPFSPYLLLLPLVIFPLVVGIAILRYHLWDIDIILNRALVYSTLTILLAIIYIASVLGLELVLHPLTRGNLAASVISTLLIAALFAPLRNRIQEFIDRRFFRRKYDLEQLMNRFASITRLESDPEFLAGEILKVATEAMQPGKASIWIQKPVNQHPHNIAYSRDKLKST